MTIVVARTKGNVAALLAQSIDHMRSTSPRPSPLRSPTKRRCVLLGCMLRVAHPECAHSAVAVPSTVSDKENDPNTTREPGETRHTLLCASAPLCSASDLSRSQKRPAFRSIARCPPLLFASSSPRGIARCPASLGVARVGGPTVLWDAGPAAGCCGDDRARARQHDGRGHVVSARCARALACCCVVARRNARGVWATMPL